MTYDEMVALQQKTRKRPRGLEHQLQCKMVAWFRMQYPYMRHNLFAVPNGGKRDAVTAAKLKAEGQLSGVSDLILLKRNKYYGALLIETKTKTGRQSDSQKDWQSKITQDGYKYVVVRSVEEFVNEVYRYLNDKE